MSNNQQKADIAIVIPVLNAGIYRKELIRSLSMQINVSYKVVCVDSDSSDGSPKFMEDSGFSVVRIPRESFSHGGTRNYGARLAAGADILVFMTQDALPKDERWLQTLTNPILFGEVAATFARQVPRPQASLLEQFSRYFNYPDTSQVRDVSDIPRLGVKAFFFSNVCSAVRADVFWSMGGFPEHVIMNEDMTLAARLLRAGYRIQYVAESEVIHSHDYTLGQQFRRNFDVGAFLSSAGPELAGARVGGEGVRFVREQVRYVLRRGRVDLLPLVFAEAAVKFTGFQLGKRHRLFPRPLKKRLSMHSYHWTQREERK